MPEDSENVGNSSYYKNDKSCFFSDGPSHFPNILIGDERRFKQVLINLVKNALKFTSSGDRITVRVCYKKDLSLLIVEVEDTGAGIAQEDFPKLFTRFGKLSRTAS